ncbi:hypothetical protein GYMLUDRAFT_250994 [Collybiopsis luxurians FD-317 M1]|uniref:Unplaced genomic scaffold GYMLUscaffold_90, whole genome shotgun sequence n=1 Tax=Collybiopsis luxurians FD-317 M1 TaxID=944289 RepID=A0A0D0AQW7_9AGAR|nr:hypothetical protein GYMLUDRAFT_250994 [Collybiopsis luxurians FD-317 M1]
MLFTNVLSYLVIILGPSYPHLGYALEYTGDSTFVRISIQADAHGISSLKPYDQIASQDRLRVIWALELSTPVTSKQKVAEISITMAELTAACKDAVKSYTHELQFPIAPDVQSAERVIGGRKQQCAVLKVEKGTEVLAEMAVVSLESKIVDFTVGGTPYATVIVHNLWRYGSTS